MQENQATTEDMEPNDLKNCSTTDKEQLEDSGHGCVSIGSYPLVSKHDTRCTTDHSTCCYPTHEMWELSNRLTVANRSQQGDEGHESYPLGLQNKHPAGCPVVGREMLATGFIALKLACDCAPVDLYRSSSILRLFLASVPAGPFAPADLSSSAEHDVVTDYIIIDGPLRCSSWFSFDVPADPSSSSSACSWFLSYQLIHYAPADKSSDFSFFYLVPCACHRAYLQLNVLGIRIRPPVRQRKTKIMEPGGDQYEKLNLHIRQSGPRPDLRLLRQTALEVLTRSARSDSPRKTRPEQIPAKLAAAAAAHGGGGGGERREGREACDLLGLG
ncbi:hypothetical protein F511_14513 [Dorcoceras hygrometricum]|uniref:Uncharacterized protein n=1 Tax=Dorcoceras hygrometricum TaxID=472368 RepID=A0A2Z7BNV6_9LAMI|nr:hypothetical protein F511_14513 [Dorcoceras hygrometricum]